MLVLQVETSDTLPRRARRIKMEFCRIAFVPLASYYIRMSKTTAKIGKLYRTIDAAVYLGLSHHTIRKYVQRELLVPYMTVGQNYLFLKPELDRYRREKRAVGRRKA